MTDAAPRRIRLKDEKRWLARNETRRNAIVALVTDTINRSDSVKIAGFRIGGDGSVDVLFRRTDEELR